LKWGARTISEGNTIRILFRRCLLVSAEKKFCGFAEGIQSFLSKATVLSPFQQESNITS